MIKYTPKQKEIKSVLIGMIRWFFGIAIAGTILSLPFYYLIFDYYDKFEYLAAAGVFGLLNAPVLMIPLAIRNRKLTIVAFTIVGLSILDVFILKTNQDVPGIPNFSFYATGLFSVILVWKYGLEMMFTLIKDQRQVYDKGSELEKKKMRKQALLVNYGAVILVTIILLVANISDWYKAGEPQIKNILISIGVIVVWVYFIKKRIGFSSYSVLSDKKPDNVDDK